MPAAICAAPRNSQALQLWAGLQSVFKTWGVDAGAQRGRWVHPKGTWQQGPEGCEWRKSHPATLCAEGFLLCVLMPVSCYGLWGWCCSMSSSISSVSSEQGCMGALMSSRAEDLFSSSAPRSSLHLWVQRCLVSWTVPFCLRLQELGKQFRFMGGEKGHMQILPQMHMFFYCTLSSWAWELTSLFLTLLKEFPRSLLYLFFFPDT